MQQLGVVRDAAVNRVMHVAETVEPRIPVAAAKIRIPPGSATTLLRERVHALLDKAVAGTSAGPPVTLVCAPAGSGKTTALATWARHWVDRDRGFAAWVNLDSDDNNPALLWAAILRALRDGGALRRTGPRDQIVPLPDEPYATFIAAITSALDQAVRPVILVLDGIHEVTSPESLRTLNILLRHTPAMLRVVLATRLPPPLIVARLNLEGRLH